MRISGVGVGAALVVLALGGCGAGAGGRAAGAGASASPTNSSAAGAPGSGATGPGAPGSGATGSGAPGKGGGGAARQGAEGAGAAATRIGPCAGAAMTGRVTSPDAGAGNRYAELIVTNTGGDPCDATGFVDLRLYDAQGRALPTDVRQEGAAGVTQPGSPLIVPPGGHAYAGLHWGVVPGDGDAAEGPCQPSPATMGVAMPGDGEWFRVAWGYGPVCEAGRIDVRALRGGLPPAGSAAPAPRSDDSSEPRSDGSGELRSDGSGGPRSGGSGGPRSEGAVAPAPTGGPVDGAASTESGPQRD